MKFDIFHKPPAERSEADGLDEKFTLSVVEGNPSPAAR